jgi:hypothetical protein
MFSGASVPGSPPKWSATPAFTACFPKGKSLYDPETLETIAEVHATSPGLPNVRMRMVSLFRTRIGNPRAAITAYA